MLRQMMITSAAILSATIAQADVSGTYSAQGRNPNGTAYQGEVRIIEQDDAVSVKWQVGNDSYAGAGVIVGDVMTVEWGAQHPVFYLIMPDGELHGTWADGAGLEKLTPR